MKRRLLLGFLILILSGVSVLPVAISAQDDEAMETDSAWWQETTWYLIYVRSFYDSDGDGIGDLQGIIEQLDYLNDGDPTTHDDLGVTGLWLLPVNEAPSVHKYDPSDYRAIDRDYGTMDDYRQLLEEAHARGMRVVVDLVINHSGNQHPWFQAAASGDEQFRDYYVWSDDDPGETAPWQGGGRAWHRSNASGGDYYYGVFAGIQPDLNHENPAVTQEIYDIATFWLDDVGVDGFRLDAVKYLIEGTVNERRILEDLPATRDYLRAFSDHVHSVNPDAVTIAEIFDPSLVVKRYMDEDVADMAFEFEMAEAMLSAASAGNKRNIEREVQNVLFTYDADEVALFLSNHDQARTMTVLQNDLLQAKVAANLLLTLPGSPFIYYGEEIGMAGDLPDEFVRRPMQWTEGEFGGFSSMRPWYPLAPDFAENTVEAQFDDADSLLTRYRNLIHLRNAYPALQYGDTELIDSNYRAAWATLRYTDDETLLIVYNLDDRESRDYMFSLDDSPFTEFTSAELIFATNPYNEDIPVPQLNAEGGFEAYIPIASPMPPASLYVIRLE